MGNKGEFYGITKEDEDKKLKHIVKVADDRLKATQESVQSLQEELHELKEVYDVEDKEGLAQWFNTDARFQEVRRDLLRAERAKKKPYFGRIDIVDPESEKKETFYIGKTVIGENPAEPEVIDWRAPISSVYYDHSLGKCNYKVPTEGIFSVDLQRKRTYEIEDNEVKDFYDSDVVANDELLTKYLSKSKRNVLSEIIATIQEEQNEVIRKNPRRNVLVQGSAGSGKTTVAMHRISYILYNYDLEFKPESFYIVGSNKVLLDYITGVLPDLDVYGVSQMTMEELFIRLLYEDWDSKAHSVRRFEKTDKSIGVKGSSEWFKALKEFCDYVEWNHVPREDIVIEEKGVTVLKASEIEKALKEYPEWAMHQKFIRLNDLLMSRLENEIYGRYYSYNVEEQKKLTRRFKDYFFRFDWKESVMDLYSEFVSKQKERGVHVLCTKDKYDLYDLASLAYIYKRIKETEVIQEASHVVIDEAQDFGMMVYRSLKYCMSKCTFTVMGDVSQNINFGAGLSDWEELKEVMLPDKYDYFGLLRKSYRNTIEISEFATDILRHGTFPIYPVEPIIRHGEKVEPVECSNQVDLNKKVASRLSKLKAANYETIAVICKDQEEAEYVFEVLSDQMPVKLFSEEDTQFGSGIVVVPIEYSKGLEFDAVVIYNASKEAYPKEDGYAKLLYVAATRALHELWVFYKEELTGLVADPIPEGRKEFDFKNDDFHIQPYVYEEEFKTREEIAREQALEGDRERALRDKYGPKKIEVKATGIERAGIEKAGIEAEKPKTRSGIIINDRPTVQRPVAKRPVATSKATVAGERRDTPVARQVSIKKAEAPVSIKLAYDKPVEVKKSASEYGEMPGGSLQPAGHGRIDNSVKWVQKDKKYVDITGAYGVLRIVPVSRETVRILFTKGMFGNIKALPLDVVPDPSVKWTLKDSREAVEVTLEKLTVRVEKRTGALSFVSSSGNVLLTEKADLPRQANPSFDCWWEFFDFAKKENLGIRGPLDTDWKEIDKTARYISHGPASGRAALIMSSKGYQILVPGGIKTLLCTIPAYGPYVAFEDVNQIDYIFRAAK